MKPILSVYIACRHFSSELGLCETSSRVELHQKHGLAVLLDISGSRSPRSLETKKDGFSFRRPTLCGPLCFSSKSARHDDVDGIISRPPAGPPVSDHGKHEPGNKSRTRGCLPPESNPRGVLLPEVISMKRPTSSWVS